MIAPPPARRRSEGGGLAVLVVVTVLAWLAAPHAGHLRRVAADGLPTRPAALSTGDPGTQGPDLHRRGWLPTRRRLHLAASRPSGPPAAGRRAAQYRIRVSCLRTGHSWYVKGTRRVSNHSVWRGVDLDQVDGRPVSPVNIAARRLALWIGRGRAGVQPSEVGSPWAFGGRPWFSDAGHRGHLHVGFAGPTQPGGAR